MSHVFYTCIIITFTCLIETLGTLGALGSKKTSHMSSRALCFSSCLVTAVLRITTMRVLAVPKIQNHSRDLSFVCAFLYIFQKDQCSSIIAVASLPLAMVPILFETYPKNGRHLSASAFCSSRACHIQIFGQTMVLAFYQQFQFGSHEIQQFGSVVLLAFLAETI